MAHNFIRSIQKIGLHTKVLLVREELSDHKLTRDCLHIQAADRSMVWYGMDTGCFIKIMAYPAGRNYVQQETTIWLIYSQMKSVTLSL